MNAIPQALSACSPTASPSAQPAAAARKWLRAGARIVVVDVPEYGRSTRVYDVATGDLRPIASGDVPSLGPSPPTLAVSRSGAALIAEDTRVELRHGSGKATVDLEDDRAVAAAFLDEEAFVIATARGRTLRFGITKSVNREA